MNSHFVKIDETTINDHSYLSPSDDCYYLGNYTSRQKESQSHSKSNSIIHNIKKKPSTSSRAGYQYKDITMQQVAATLSANFSATTVANSTFIPIPPSKAIGHPDYDDRMLKILNYAFANRGGDVRDLLHTITSRTPTHNSGTRPSIAELEANISVNQSLITNIKSRIFILDDLITSGAQYVAVRNILQRTFGDIKITGLFICRREIEAIDPSVFDW